MFKAINNVCLTSKLVCCGGIAYLLFASGLGGWGYSLISGLAGDYMRLQRAYDNLQKENDIYSKENDNYEKLNRELSKEAIIIGKSIKEYISLNKGFAELVDAMNDTSVEMNVSVATLTYEGGDTKINNDDFKNLLGWFDRVSINYRELLGNLHEIVIELNETIQDLKGQQIEFNSSLKELDAEVYDLSTKIDKLQNVTVFLKENGIETEEDLELLETEMKENIETMKKILDNEMYENLKLDMKYATARGIDKVLSYFNFLSNNSMEKAMLNSYPQGLDKCYTGVLDKLCRNTTDFEEYVFEESGLSQITINQISYYDMVDYLYFYRDRVYKQYFPTDGSTAEKWKERGYECS